MMSTYITPFELGSCVAKRQDDSLAVAMRKAHTRTPLSPRR